MRQEEFYTMPNGHLKRILDNTREQASLLNNFLKKKNDPNLIITNF